MWPPPFMVARASGAASCLRGALKLHSTAACLLQQLPFPLLSSQQLHTVSATAPKDSAAAPTAKQAAQAALQQGLFSITQVPGQGRGLVADQPLQYGQLLFTEQPLLTAPSLQHTSTVCRHCLRAHVPIKRSTARSSQASFCSWDCNAAALSSYYLVESRLGLEGLTAYCKQHEEKMPLMAAQLACRLLQEAITQAQQEELQRVADADASAELQRRVALAIFAGLGGRERACSDASNYSSSSSDDEDAGSEDSTPSSHCERPDMLRELRVLCHANVPPPAPQPWQESYQLLKGALNCLPALADSAAAAAASAEVLQRLDLRWYVDVLSRLHLNVFRVDAPLPFTSWQDLQAAASGSVTAAASPGSALYLLGALFNHSCDPNVTASWPGGNATVKFTAARDIAPGEQLTISYVDHSSSLAARRQLLEFGWGFQCKCSVCLDEMAESTSRTPPAENTSQTPP